MANYLKCQSCGANSIYAKLVPALGKVLCNWCRFVKGY
jgi:hypothetical protein